jgi:cytochrome P450
MTEAALAMLERWQIAAACGEPLDASKEMMRLTLRIAGLTLFSLDISGEADVVGRAFTEASEYVAHASLDPLALLLTGFPMPAQLRFRAALRALDKVVQGIITERRRQNRDTGDLLSMYLLARDEETGEGMNDRQLRDEVMTLLLAGHETTANTLAWTWYLLSGHPVIEQKLHAELAAVLGGRVPTVPDLPNLPYTRMVIEESMRLYPPAYGISRKAIAADEIGGYRIPANSVIFVGPYVMHRHPKFWENPDVFDPERFTPERSADRPPFAYFPFGGGPRLCIGNQFALIEAQLLLATVAQRYASFLRPQPPDRKRDDVLSRRPGAAPPTGGDDGPVAGDGTPHRDAHRDAP